VTDESLGWHVMTYVCEAWTVKKEEERRIQAFENRCNWKKATESCWEFHRLLTTEKFTRTESEVASHIKSRKLRYFWHVLRIPHDIIEASVMTGLVERVRSRGRPRISRIDNIIAWTGQLRSSLLYTSHEWVKCVFFPSAVRLWNRVPSDTCYLAPDSFKLELSKINLIWSRTKFLCRRTTRFYFLS